MKPIQNHIPVVFLCLASLAAAEDGGSTYYWTAGGDGVSLFGESNWTANPDGSGGNIPAINPNQALTSDLVVTSGNVGGAGATGILLFSTGCLEMSGGTLAFANGNGVSGGLLTFLQNANLEASFLEDAQVSATGSAQLVISGSLTDSTLNQTGATVTLSSAINSQITLANGSLTITSATPFVDTVVDFPLGSNGQANFPNIPANDIIIDYLGNFTVDSQPAVISGSEKNISVLTDGAGGSVVTPSSEFTDSDSDGLDDAWEEANFGDLSRDGTGDADSDGLTDLEEFNLATDPNDSDTDRDQLSDGLEVNTYETNPLDSDSDDDSNPDGFEVAKGTDPNLSSSRTEQPNILFIFADDLGYGDLGVLFQNAKSGKKHKTPFFDQMAAEGLILDRHYCPAPVCAPSRGSLLTGLHQGHANIRNNQFDKALEDNHNLATTLRSAGYSTHIIGKYGLQGAGNSPAEWEAYPTKRGFDTFYGYVRHGDGHTHYPFHNTPSRGAKELYDQDRMVRDELNRCFTPDLFTARAKRLIADEVNDGDDQPFFLYLAYDTPHAALQLPTVAYPGENNSDDLDTSGLGLNGGVQWLGTPGSVINTATGTIDSYRHPDYTTAVNNSWTDVEERFATLVRRMDDNLGDLRQTLVDLGIAENTLIIFTSDNGPHAEDYLSNAQTNDGSSYLPNSFQSYGPFDGIKRDCWEGGIREPSLVYWPQTIPAGTITTQHSQFHDWMPTLCDLAGLPSPARTDGVSLAPLLLNPDNPTGQEQPTTYIEYSTSGSTPNYTGGSQGGRTRNQVQVIFIDDYKGIRINTSGSEDNFEIYDTIADPGETTDLFATPPSGQEAYFAELQQRMQDRVLQLRLADGSASRPYDNAEIPASAAPANITPGLQYQSYTGFWPWVPDFSELTAQSEGISTTGLDLSVLPVSESDRGIYYEGYLQIPTAGNWTFTLTSDSGAIVRIHDILAIDDDYQHDGSPVNQTLNLASGFHPIRIYYKNSVTLTPELDLRWSGPGVVNQVIPASAFVIEGEPDPVPVVNDDNASTSATDISASPVTIFPLTNDLDDGLPAPLSLVSFSQPIGGSVSQSGESLTFIPEVGFFGPTSFDYTVTDGENTVSGKITVTVTYEPEDIWLPFQACDSSDIVRANGETVGTTSATVTRIEGRHGQGLSFDGDASDFPLPGLTNLPTGSQPRTLMAWVRVPAGQAGENQTIFGYGENINGERFSFRLNGSPFSNNPGTSNQAVRLEVQGGNIVGNTLVDDGLWHHVAVVCDDFNGNGSLEVQETRIYVDGILDTDPTGGLPAAASANRNINTAAGTTPVLGGSNHADSYTFLGDIDEFRIFPRALSSAEILNIATAESQVSEAWHRRFFGDTAPTEWTQDSDFDNLTRLEEYAFGGNPRIPDAELVAPRITYNSMTGKLEFIFRRRVPSTLYGLLYTAEASRDLIDWTTLSTIETGSSPLPSHDCLEEAFFETSASSLTEPKQFSRIKVELVP